MAIAFDNTNVALTTTSTTNSLTLAVNGINRYLEASVFNTSGDTLTSITATKGGSQVAMTQILKRVGLTGEEMYCYGMLNPDTGTITVTATFSSGNVSRLHVSSYMGVSQSMTLSSLVTTNGTNASSTSGTATLTTPSDNDWMILFVRANDNITASTNATLRGATSTSAILDTNAAQTPAGSKSMAYTVATAQLNSYIAYAIEPDTAGINIDSMDAGALGSGTSQTRAFTTAGSNRYMIAGILKQGSVTTTGVTYNGVAMTQSGTSIAIHAGEVWQLWYLSNPTVGTNNIVASFSGAGTTSEICAISFTGVIQSGMPDASGTVDVASGTSATASATTIANNDILVGISREDFGNGTAGTNTALFASTAGIAYGLVYTPTAQTPAGSKSMTLNWTGTGAGGIRMIAISPLAVATTTKRLSALGVG